MTRKGKIARLPQPIREQINRRLENGEEGKQIAEWLNTLPEVDRRDGGGIRRPAHQRNQPVQLEARRIPGLGGAARSHGSRPPVPGATPPNSARLAGAQLADQLALCLTARLASRFAGRPQRGGSRRATGAIAPVHKDMSSCARAITTRNGCESRAKNWIWA